MESGWAVSAHARAMSILALTLDPCHTHARMALILGFCASLLASAFELCVYRELPQPVATGG